MPKESNDYQNTESDPNSHNSQFRIEARLQVWWFFVCYDLGILLKDCLSWILSLFTPWFCKYDVILVFRLVEFWKIEKFALKKFVIHVREKNKKKSKTVCMSSLFLCNQQAKNEVPLLTEYIPALI